MGVKASFEGIKKIQQRMAELDICASSSGLSRLALTHGNRLGAASAQ
jgi:hypothetical protein